MNTGWDDTDDIVTLPADRVEKHAPLADGIHKDVAFDRYLKEDRVSKSGLWTAYNKSPAHARVEKKTTAAMVRGSVTHCVLLEPDMFPKRYKRGPADRRGNKWKLMLEEYGEYLLTESDYDNAASLRDAIKDNPFIRRLTGNGVFREITACATDPATGLKIKARADAYVPGDGIIVELKTTADARPESFLRVVKDFGYHMGEAHYSHTWTLAGGVNLKAFVFVALEPEPPYAVKIYELDADAVAEGEAIRQKAMETWARCVETNDWPAYAQEPEVIALRKFDYRETVPVNA